MSYVRDNGSYSLAWWNVDDVTKRLKKRWQVPLFRTYDSHSLPMEEDLEIWMHQTADGAAVGMS